jgi:hypothetical protein
MEHRTLLTTALALTFGLAMSASAFAGDEKAPAAADEAAEEKLPPRPAIFVPPKGAPPITVKLSGKYALWILNQHGFLLGKDATLDDADYAVQMLRLNLTAGTPTWGAVARLDAGQGWWGADNTPDVTGGVSTDADGNVSSIASYNTYKLFGSKDTNYAVHFDHVYAYVQPNLPFKLRLQVGRQYFKAGHKLVLDEDYDGVRLIIKPHEKIGFDLMYAILSEGLGSYKNPKGLLMNDDGNFADAHIMGGTFNAALGPVKLGVFGFHYWDKSGAEESSFLPQGYGYLVARHQPNISRLTAIGLTADAKLDVLNGMNIEFETDFLFGKDNVANTDHAGGTLDINNGTINGWNVYFKIDQSIPLGPVCIKPGFTLGAGSGDDDVTSGRGNVNKIQTMGFFPLTNVWEDSVMPDISGISPQGLGSPVSRGYREFENTFALQGRLGFTPWNPVNIMVSYTFLRAIQPIHGWDATGTPTVQASQEIGSEVDVNLTIKILPKVTYKALFGAFIPGNGAALLINGNADALETAWEMKQVFVVAF